MSMDSGAPTRMELMAKRAQIKLATDGVSLLEGKREALLQELLLGGLFRSNEGLNVLCHPFIYPSWKRPSLQSHVGKFVSSCHFSYLLHVCP